MVFRGIHRHCGREEEDRYALSRCATHNQTFTLGLGTAMALRGLSANGAPGCMVL